MRVVTPPTLNAVSVSEAKVQLAIPQLFTEHDRHLLLLIQAAERALEERTNIAFMTQVREELFDNWGWHGVNELVSYPYQGGMEVTYYDTDNAEQTLDASSYIVHDDGGLSVEIRSDITRPTLFARRSPIRVRYTAGWTAPEKVPSDLKLAILMCVAASYDDHHDRIRTEAFSFKGIPTRAEQMVLNHMKRYG